MISMNTLDDYEILQFGDFTTGDDGEAMVTDFENYLIRIGEFHNGRFYDGRAKLRFTNDVGNTYQIGLIDDCILLIAVNNNPNIKFIVVALTSEGGTNCFWNC